MQDKHKVTLYLPPELHRQLKIRSAVELEPMSAIAERAIVFYLTHSDVVDEVEMSHGHAHRVYSCPECTSQLVLKEGEIRSIGEQPGILVDEDAPVGRVQAGHSNSDQRDEGELVTCL